MRRRPEWRVLALLAILPWLALAQSADEAETAGDDAVEQAANDARRFLDLEAQERVLAALKGDIETRLEQLRALQQQLLAAIVAEESAKAADVATLVTFYQSMKPKGAARLLEQLPLGLATDVVAAMKPRQAAKILDVMEAGRAVRISRRMTGA